MTFPQHVLDAIAHKEYQHPNDPPGKLRRGQNDAPRAMLAWAFEGRFEEQPHRWPLDTGGITDNHRIEAAGGSLLAGLWEWRGWVVAFLRRILTEGDCLGEQGPSTYDKHWGAGLTGIALAALERGDGELLELALDCLRRWLALRLLCTCPGDAHPNLAHRSLLAGRRCGDTDGMSVERDVIVRLLTGQPVPRSWRWSIHQETQMEPHLVAEAMRRGMPVLQPGALPKLVDQVEVAKYAHGHRVVMPQSSMRSGRGGCILWAVQADYRTGEVDSVSWKDVGLTYKQARQMGGGPMPRPLPSRDLGPLLSEEWIPSGNEAPRPDPPPPPDDEPEEPEEPEEPAPPAPPEDSGLRIAPKGEHVVLLETSDHPPAVIRILPGNRWETVRIVEKTPR